MPSSTRSACRRSGCPGVAWLVLAVTFGLAERNNLQFSYTLSELSIARHIPYFAIGILFNRIRTRPQDRRIDIGLLGLCLLALAVAFKPVYAEMALACTAIFGVLAAGWLGALRWAHFAFLGTISYSLYLLHQAIGFSLIWRLEHFGVSAGLAALSAAALVTILSVLLTFLVERPAMRAIRRAWKAHREASAVPNQGPWR